MTSATALSLGGSLPLRLMRAVSDSPRSSSITRYEMPFSVTPESRISMMCGWRMELAARASFMKRARDCSSRPSSGAQNL